MGMVRAGGFALLVALAAAVACSPAPAPPPEPRTLRLAMDYWAGYYPAVLADELGYLREEGLALELTMPSDTDAMLAEFTAGRHDLVGTALGDLIVLSRRRDDIRVLLVADESSGGDALLARPGLDDATRPLRVGTNIGGFGELFLEEAWQAMGLGPDDIRLLEVEGADVPAALAAGRIDLGHTWEPYVSEAEALGAVRRFDSSATPGLIPDVIATRADVASERPDDLRAFNRAWFRASAWWATHPDEGNALLERRLGLAPGSVSLKGVALLDLEANRRTQSGPLVAVIERYSAYFVRSGVLLATPDADAMPLVELLPPPAEAP